MDLKIFYHLNSHKIFFWLFFVTFLFQIFFWKKTEKFKPSFDLIPPAPSKYLTSALSLGDKEFLFRVLVLRLQNSGDIFAGFVALKNYDYSRLYQWMKALDELNSKANSVPALASYYYSQTQKVEDTRYIVDYLDEHASLNIDENWWWVTQAIYLAKGRLQDIDLALKLAYKLSANNSSKAPLWTKQMPAFIHEEKGGKDDGCMAFFVIQKLIKESESGARQIKPEEMNFMRHFINDRLTKLKKQNFNPSKCQKIN
jgi:hypothetical protein